MATSKIKKGDLVRVIAGKDKDKEGKVLSVNKKDNTVLVEGINMVTKHTKPSAQNQNTGKGYTAGAMLLGNISLKKYSEAIKRDFSEVRDQIRYISITGNMKQAAEVCDCKCVAGAV